MSLRDRLLKSPAPAVAAVVRDTPDQLGYCPDCGAQLTRENASRLVSGAIRHVSCPKEPPAVLPPDAPLPKPVQPAPEVTPAAEQPAPVAEQPAPKRRGRPPKAKPAPEQPAPAPEQPAPESKPAPESGPDLRELFIDCIPTRGYARGRDLSTYAARMPAKVSEAGGVDDLRFAGSDSPLAFGKWKGALAMLVREELPPPGVYVAFGLAHSELLQVVVEALEPLCDVVVRSVR